MPGSKDGFNVTWLFTAHTKLATEQDDDRAERYRCSRTERWTLKTMRLMRSRCAAAYGASDRRAGPVPTLGAGALMIGLLRAFFPDVERATLARTPLGM